ncbi:MAG: hypothetical protein LAT84_06045 [Balneolia bacterium]|nr:hypothetical protein [Balneolia bacterium]
MTTHDILRDFRKKAPVSESDMDVFLEIARPCSFRKNEIILSQGNTKSPLMLIKKGCVMTYHGADG